jgi:DNA repair photolyase
MPGFENVAVPAEGEDGAAAATEDPPKHAAIGDIAPHKLRIGATLEISPMFQDWLQEHFPDRAQKVMNIIRQSRGGSDYRSAFGERMRGTGHFADLLNSRWRVSSRKLGYSSEDRHELDYSQFKTSNEQLALF